MKRLADMFYRLCVYRDVAPSPVLDIVKELHLGKLILVDSGIHSPVQYWIRQLAMWDEFVDQKTVEIRSWSAGHYSHPNFRKFVERRDGENRIRGDKMRFLGDYEYFEPMKGTEYDRKRELTDQLKASFQAVEKTVVKFRYHDEKEISKIEALLAVCIHEVRSLATIGAKLPVFLIEIGIMYDTPRIRFLIHELHNLGASVVVIRLVDTPTPISDMVADIHIVERTPFLDYLHAESEIFLASGTYATVTPFYRTLKRRFWQTNRQKGRPIPSISAYNADPEGYRG